MGDQETKGQIQIHYEKNPLYRTAFADGAIAGSANSNSVNLTFYATRPTIPKSIIHKLNPDGLLEDLVTVSEDSKKGIIREIEVGVYMSHQTAKELYFLLKKIIDQNDL